MHLTFTTIFIYLVIFCVGAAIGGLIERALKRRPTPPPPLPVSNKDTLAEAGDVEILSAWRTSSNKVWLNMDGTRLNDKKTLQPGQYQRLLNLVLDLRPWLETTKPAAPRAEPTMQSFRPATPTAAVTQQPVIAEKKNGKPADEAIQPAPVLDSIIQQIDKVLQDRLATSAFKDRDIQLVEGPGGIVIVKDGENRYEGVDAIADPEIKNLIRQAVTAWENGAR